MKQRQRSRSSALQRLRSRVILVFKLLLVLVQGHELYLSLELSDILLQFYYQWPVPKMNIKHLVDLSEASLAYFFADLVAVF